MEKPLAESRGASGFETRIGMNMYELYNGRSPQTYGTGTLFWDILGI